MFSLSVWSEDSYGRWGGVTYTKSYMNENDEDGKNKPKRSLSKRTHGLMMRKTVSKQWCQLHTWLGTHALMMRKRKIGNCHTSYHGYVTGLG